MLTLASVACADSTTATSKLIGIGEFELGRRRGIVLGQPAEEFENLLAVHSALDHVPHRIEAGRLAERGSGRGERAAGEDHPALGAVRQARSARRRPSEDHDMLAGDRAAAERGEADRAGLARIEARRCGRSGRARLERRAAALGRRLAEHQRGAGRRVDLVAVVHLERFRCPSRVRARGGRLLDQVAQQGDAERGVRRAG